MWKAGFRDGEPGAEALGGGKEAAERGPRSAEEESRRVCGGGPAAP